MDVVFIVDETGSMSQVISAIQGQVTQIANEVVNASGGDYQFGLIGMPDNNIDVLLNPTANNRAALDTAVQSLGTAGGCGGVPYDEALVTAIRSLPARSGSSGEQLNPFSAAWRSNSTKIIILITDTFPQSFTCSYQQGTHDVAVHDAAVEALAAGIHISAIFVPTGNQPESEIAAIMQDAATSSSGIYKQSASDASDLVDIIFDIIKTCGGAGPSANELTMILDPREILLSNDTSGESILTDYIPSPDTTAFTYEATGLPDDSTITFTPRQSTQEGTTAQTVTFNIGPTTPQGTYVVTIKASHPNSADRFAIAIVGVDCRPVFVFPTADNMPQSETVPRGTTATLKVRPSGDGPFTYQWYRGHRGHTSFPVTGATTSELITTAINTADQYWVRISNPCGSYDSFTATVTPQ